MKPLAYYGKAVLIDLVMAVLLWLWLFSGAEGAGNVFRVIFWTMVPLTVIGLVLAPEAALEPLRRSRPRHFRRYNVPTDLAFAAVLAWSGHEAMAVFILARLAAVELFLESEQEEAP